MTWQDDSWRDSYDAWKTREPDEPEECYHESFEIGHDGMARCDACFESWRATAEEIEAQRERLVEYDAWCVRQERREYLRRLTWWVRWPIYRLLERIWPRKSCRVLFDEEIPF